MNTPNQLIEAAEKLLRLERPDCCDSTEAERRSSAPTKAWNNLAAAIEASTQDDWQDISSAAKEVAFQAGRMDAAKDILGINEAAMDDDVRLDVRRRCTEIHTEAQVLSIPNPPTAQPDEQVCSTCGGKLLGFGIGCGQCPDRQPAPPSEGEVAAGPEIPDEIGVWAKTRPLEPSWFNTNWGGNGSPPIPETDEPDSRVKEHERVEEIAVWITAQMRESYRRGLAANTPPDGHVAVYLPVEVAERRANSSALLPQIGTEKYDWLDGGDGAEREAADREVIDAACRTALEVE